MVVLRFARLSWQMGNPSVVNEPMASGRAAMSDSEPTFGDVLRRLRTAASLSQGQLAERAGLSRNGIADLERGVRRTPRLETVRMLAEALSLSDSDRALLLAAARPALFRDDATIDAPDAPAAPTPLAAMPMPLTPLVGREQEVAAILALVQDPTCRLLTLTGPGGVGKTRLALAAAEAAANEFADGVVFVPLAPIADSGLVPSAIITALGVREAGVASLTERLKAILRDKQLLLVLDNFEHVVDAAPLVVLLLEAGPRVKVMVTSRMRLRVSAEREHAVPPLGLAEPGQVVPVDRADQSAAVRLFVARAQAVQEDFVLTPDNAAAVNALCRRLDGLPLAIELAAARVKVLPPRALLARLEQRLPVLTGGGRDLPARQQTMRDTIAWSYDLLTPVEQILFRRLAVFVGGCTLAAAAAVVSNGVYAASDPFEGIASLVDKSVLKQELGANDEPRFGMLETVREFALEQLAASGEEATVRARHAAWCLAEAEAAGHDMQFGHHAAWLASLDLELDNVRTAVSWFQAAGDAQCVLQLVSGLEEFWMTRPYHAEVLEWLQPALAATSTAPGTIRAAALLLAANLTNFLGDTSAALAYAQEGLVLARSLGDPFILGRAHWAYGMVCMVSGDTPRAITAYAAALPPLREANVPFWAALALAELGDALHRAGEVASAVPLLDEAVEINRSVGSPFGGVAGLGERAHTALTQGDPVLAAHLFAETIAIAQRIGVERIVLGAVAGLAGVALALGQPRRAVRLLGAVEAARETSGAGRIGDAWHAERILAAARTALPEPAFAAAWEEGRSLPFTEAIAEVTAMTSSTGALFTARSW
jgi:predicted ATPase/transcriptional regulator with XRE-family HTH domain